MIDEFEKQISSFFPFWNLLSGEHKQSVLSFSKIKKFEKNTIIHQGYDDCIGLILVLSGQLRVYTVSDEGKELTLYRLVNNDICLLSASCMISELQFEFFVSVIENSQTIIIPATVYKKIMSESVEASNYINRLMAMHFSDVMWVIDQIQNKKMDSRLAALILEEANLRNSNVLNITHEQLANHLGTAREVVTRMLKYFQDDALIFVGRGFIEIKNIEKLESIAKDSIK